MSLSTAPTTIEAFLNFAMWLTDFTFTLALKNGLASGPGIVSIGWVGFSPSLALYFIDNSMGFAT